MLLANKYFPMHLWNKVNRRFVSVESLELVGCKDIIYRVFWLIKLNSKVPVGKIHTTKFCFYHQGVKYLLLSFFRSSWISFLKCVLVRAKRKASLKDSVDSGFTRKKPIQPKFSPFSQKMVDIVFTRRKPIHPKTFQVGGSVVTVNLPHGNQYNQIFTFNLFSLTFREVVDWTGY